MIRKTAFAGILFICHLTAGAQDSLKNTQLDEVMVTATRNERTVGALPMPVSLISQSTIRTMGSLRLQDVLTEQTGLAIVPQVNGSGNGLQLQGFNPDYTLILIDGEPLIGRYTGSLELGRLAVGNIKQIEVVKGPSSSLYGSDALAGVVNIITERPREPRGSIYSRFGTNNTLDLSGDLSRNVGPVGVYLFLNRYSTDGYDLTPEHFGKTVSPFRNYTGTTKVAWKINDKTELMVSGRLFTETQDFDYEVQTNTQEFVRTSGGGRTDEWNINPVLTHRFNTKLKTTFRFYATGYQTSTKLNNTATDTLYYTDHFRQSFTRPEVNAEYYFNDKHVLTAGVGQTAEVVQTSRYGDESERNQATRYFFLQHEWTPLTRLNVIVGGRYDNNTSYGGQFSPKLSTRYELTNRITLKGSFGVGFKAPDFRQLYFNFNNSAGGGYSVLGTEVVRDRLAQMESQGLIQGYAFNPALIGNLEAERSVALNAGARYAKPGSWSAEVNLFYNSIDNLIETQAVAFTTASQTIYSYRNIKRAYTDGVELNTSYPLSQRVTLSLGYQLLFAKDKDVADQVSAGNVFWRDPQTLETRRLQSSEYFGLYNRSRHMGNIKLFYSDRKGWEASARMIYRGPYGVGDIRGNIQGELIPPSDVNNNGILDSYDRFVGGYALVNLSIARTIGGLRLQAGVDNLFDHTDRLFIPNLPGRIIYTSVSYNFMRHSGNKTK